MQKLLALVAAMQDNARRYTEPTPFYLSHTNQRSDAAGQGLEQPQRNYLFALDMIRALDGPEEREALAEAQAALADYNALLGVECDSECQRQFWAAVEDVKSHAEDWRSALKTAFTESRGDSYWQHQLNVLDRILAGLARVKPETPVPQPELALGTVQSFPISQDAQTRAQVGAIILGRDGFVEPGQK